MSLYIFLLALFVTLISWFTFKEFYKTYLSYVSIWLLLQVATHLFFVLLSDDFDRPLKPTVIALVGYLTLLFSFRFLPKTLFISNQSKYFNYEKIFGTHWLMIIGALLKIFAIFINSNNSFLYYFDNQHEYDTTLRSAGFLDIGLDIFIFGAALHSIYCIRDSFRRKIFIIFVCLFISIVSSSKAPILAFITIFYFLYRTAPLKIDLNINLVQLIAFILLAALISGLKTQIKYLGLGGVTWSVEDWLFNFIGLLEVRLGFNGLYEGYENIVSRLDVNPSLLLNGDAIYGVFLSVIPGFLFSSLSEKTHPFRAIGYLTNSDFHIDPDANNPVTFFGFAYIDYGLIGYFFVLLFFGIFFIFLSKMLLKIPSYPGRLAFLFFVLNFLPRMVESGYLNILYWWIMSLSVAFVVALRHFFLKYPANLP